ncbi:carboxypeptidase-like regulatory domain-containing protein [Arcticibacter eurypsychrophilus]|uniref:carboxypeptidase-like regulatory domain-containing protein n=1 Tax=Arcticibacter eurypsychrophilus TaxID=1434752 RepID=UPI00084D0A14|nr:carboxypeptidase-like regulatory domain-containing protein [Arcticibacter eurypsychrophilus]
MISFYQVYKACIVVFVVFISFRVEAQQSDKKIDFILSQKEIEVTGNDLTNIILKVINRGNLSLNARVRIVGDKSMQLLSKENRSVTLQPGDSLFIPVKFLMPDKLTAGLDYRVNCYLEDEKGLLKQETCIIRIGIKKNVTMTALISNIVLSGQNDSINIPVRIANEGNTVQKISIVPTFPSTSQGSGFHSTIQLTIPAFKDTLIYIHKPITREILQSESYLINILGIYFNGDLFGQSNVDVQVLKSIRKRNFDPETTQYRGNYNNNISLTAQNFLNEYAAYELAGGGVLDFPGTRLGYNIDATVFQNNPNNPNLRNTFISLESHNTGLTVGNIARNFDLNLNGRGATAFLADTARKNNYEVGYIDNSSNLITNSGNLVYDSGRSAWGKFEHTGKSLVFQTTAIYNKDPYMLVDNVLIGNDFSWITSKKNRFSATFNAGSTDEFNDSTKEKLGFLAGLNADWKIRGLLLNSSNLVSTGYYPGNRKGSSIFTERLSYYSKSINLWAGFNYFNYHPSALASSIYSNKYGSSKSEIGISKIFGNLSFLLSPVYQTEMGQYSLVLNSYSQEKIEALRLVTQMNYSNRVTKQSLFINLESGVAHNSFNDKDQFQLKVSGNYRHGPFNINTNLQYGNFYLGEAFNSYTRQIGNFSSFSIVPGIQKKLFKNKMIVDAGISYNKSSTIGKSWLLTGRTEYQLSSGTQCFASLAGSQYTYDQNKYTSNNLQLGITQKIANARLGKNLNTLEVFVYKDENQNGQYDGGDSNAMWQLIYISGTAFITNREGVITYKNLKESNYSIAIPTSGQWYSPDQQILLNQKHIRLEIPLSKTATLKGKITYLFNDFSYEIKKAQLGVTIQASDERGRVTKTKTDDTGQFVFYLPVGNYTISIASNDLPEEVTCSNNNQDVLVVQEIIGNVNFELNVKGRKVETKKFVSPSLLKSNIKD